MTTMTPAEQADSALNEQQCERLAALADLLIAGGSWLPSATEAEVHTSWVYRILAARPDLTEVVQRVTAEQVDPQHLLDQLRAEDTETFEAFAYTVAGADLINRRVRKLLSYPGPSAPAKNPAFPDEADAYLEDGILEPVIERGSIYRPTPTGT